jgi:hypothetical protein
MDPIEEQFQQLHALYPTATLERRGDGTSLVVLPHFPLPPGWSTPTTEVVFVVPLGYPVARPDTFWTSPDLRLASGGFPANTQLNANYGDYGNRLLDRLWFSYHPSTWNPSYDTLTTYVKLIRRRLQEPQ